MNSKSVVRVVLFVSLALAYSAGVALAAPSHDCEKTVAAATLHIGNTTRTLVHLTEIDAPQHVIDLFQERLLEQQIHWYQKVNDACG